MDGTVALLVLAALAEKPAHGYAVIERLRDRSEGAFDLREGTVYPLLHRLEADGLLDSRWDTTAGRRRREYRLTRRGNAALDERREEWRRYALGVERVVGARA
jgi:PadR family transcriptional regulator PadR